DRYVASNAAYGAARLQQSVDGEFVAWVRELEIERFDLPVPDAQILLRVPPDVAGERARGRAAADAARGRDSYESDGQLQARVASVYDDLAAAAWLSEWHVVDGEHEGDARKLAIDLGFDSEITRTGHEEAVRRKRQADTAGACRVRSHRVCEHRVMRRRVLVVDDDPARSEMRTIMLRGERFGTAVVADGSRALPAVRELRPDLVLLDLMLPGMNGIDVCKA